MWAYAALFALCWLLMAVAAAAQAAFGHLNATRLRRLMQQGASRSQAMHEVVHHPGPFFLGIALLSLVAAGGGATVLVGVVVGLSAEPWEQVALVLVGALLLLVGEMVGRNAALVDPERTAELFYAPLRLLGLATLPLYLAVDFVVLRLLRIRPDGRANTNEEDLRVLVDAVEETEALEADEREMITSIFELSDRDVKEIMVPRMDIVAAEASASVAVVVDQMISTGHSRIPVYEEELDHLSGLVHLRDLAGALRTGADRAAVGDFARPVHVVPETKKIDELLREFQKEGLQLAMVVDEYGGTSGLVTIEDLLEEIVGEIRDEYDVEEDRIQKLSDREAIMDARVSVHDANEVLELNLDPDQSDTIGGVVYARLDKVPAPGDVVELDRGTIRVISTRGRTIQRVHVTLNQ